MLRLYGKSLEKWPILTSSFTSGILMCMGDAYAQRLEKQRFDWKRNAITSSWNALVFSPVFFYWFKVLDKLFPGPTVKMALSKVLCNQVVMVLPINVGFLTYTTVLENLTKDKNDIQLFTNLQNEVMAKVNDRALRICWTSLLVWGPTNMINFLFVPVQYRILPTIFVSFAWNVFLSTTAHLEKQNL